MEHSQNYKRFFYATAICSFLGALTTALLLFLPNPEAADFESSALLHTNTLHLTKLWILFIHPQVNFLAALGVAVLLYKKYTLSIIFGTVFLLLWAFTELSQQALLIDSLNQIWRPGYLTAGEEDTKTMFRTLIHAANGISDSKYFLVIYGFGIGSLLYGFALVREQGLGRGIGYALLFIGLLSLASFVRYYLGLSSLNSMVNWCYTWVYPALQPLVRIGLGIWIFLELKKRPV